MNGGKYTNMYSNMSDQENEKKKNSQRFYETILNPLVRFTGPICFCFVHI